MGWVITGWMEGARDGSMDVSVCVIAIVEMDVWMDGCPCPPGWVTFFFLHAALKDERMHAEFLWMYAKMMLLLSIFVTI